MTARKVNGLLLLIGGLVIASLFIVLGLVAKENSSGNGLAIIYTLLITAGAAAMGIGASEVTTTEEGILASSVGTATGQYATSGDAPTSGMAIASFVLGLVSLVGGGAVTGIPAAITGWMALRETSDPIAPRSGRWMAITGFALGLISTVAFAILLIFLLIIYSAA